MTLALALRRLHWRDSADRILLEEEVQASTENARQCGPGKSGTPAIGREGTEASASVGD